MGGPGKPRAIRTDGRAMSQAVLTAAEAGFVSCETCSLVSRPVDPLQDLEFK